MPATTTAAINAAAEVSTPSNAVVTAMASRTSAVRVRTVVRLMHGCV